MHQLLFMAFPEKPKGIELKFGELYVTPEWRELELKDRAQLIMVAEGVKPGTTIGGNLHSFLKIIEKMGLEASLNTHPLSMEAVFKVAAPEIMKRHRLRLLTADVRATVAEFYRINGEFYGYPACCTEEYNNPQKSLKERKIKSPHEFLSNVDFEMEKSIRTTGSYPVELDFCPPSFTPCSAHCPEALKILGLWKSVVETADPEAATELQIFNRINSPAKSIYHEEIQRAYEERVERFRVAFLRWSVGGNSDS